MKPRILNLCSPWQIATVFQPEVWAELCEFCTVVNAEVEEDAVKQLVSCDGALTGWGSSFVFTSSRIANSPRLRLIAHTAGSVKGLLPEAAARSELQSRCVMVYSGSTSIAINVAESTIGYLILAIRRWPELAHAYPSQRKPGIAMPGDNPVRNGRFLTGATIGLVGLSTVALLTIPLLRPFGCHILAYDPYVSESEAQNLGVELMGLDDLFSHSDAISIHAPELPQTRGLIGKHQLKLLRDGAALVNTSRGSVLDSEALLAEVITGRISVALDVTDPEPLPADSPFWGLPNVFITPHTAAMGHGGLFQVGAGALAAIQHLAGETTPLVGIVPLERWEIIA